MGKKIDLETVVFRLIILLLFGRAVDQKRKASCIAAGRNHFSCECKDEDLLHTIPLIIFGSIYQTSPDEHIFGFFAKTQISLDPNRSPRFDHGNTLTSITMKPFAIIPAIALGILFQAEIRDSRLFSPRK